MCSRFSLLAILALALTACQQQPMHQKVDDLAVLPDGAVAKSKYARFYTLIDLKSDEDLPFTTSHTFTLDAPRQVWVGMFTDDVDITANTPRVPLPSSGATRIEAIEDFPKIFHGGCHVINLVADTKTGQTLASWCNVDDRPSASPFRVPYYFAENSPLREN